MLIINKCFYLLGRFKSLIFILLYGKKYQEELKKKILHLSVETINICNANCTFCAYGLQERPEGIMTESLFKKIILDYVKIGGGDLGLTPTVGEPFADKDIVSRVKFARSFPEIKKIGTYTNLISLGIFNINDVVTCGFSELTISTSGFDEDMYLRIYRSKQYKRMYNNLIKLLKVNKAHGSPIDISIDMRSDFSLAQTRNLKDYKNILNYISESKCIYKFRYDDWAGKIKQKDLSGKMKIRKNNSPFHLRISPCFEYFNGPHIYRDGKVGICGCRDVDAKNLIIGDVNENSIKEIWQNQKHKEYMDRFHTNPPNICAVCSHYNNVSVLANDHHRKLLKNQKIIYK